MAFMLASSTVTRCRFMNGKASDLYGRRPLFVISIVVFLIGSALCGLAHSMMQLIVCRRAPGRSRRRGADNPGTDNHRRSRLTPRERGRYQGLFTGVFAFYRSVAGPLLGGLLIRFAVVAVDFLRQLADRRVWRWR